MKKKSIIYLIICLFIDIHFSTEMKGQDLLRKFLIAKKTESKPFIDGQVTDSIWNDMPIARNFIQFEPYNGVVSNYKSEVRIAYDNEALYIAAILFDKKENISTGLGPRDSWNSKSDKFGLWLAPYNDGINGFEFWVTAAGVQIDAKRFLHQSDLNWDEIWTSEVAITDSSWNLEMEIPYAALRFPKNDIQSWGINFWRISQKSGESSTWNYIDREVSGSLNQSGELYDLKDIRPPLRLSFSPYASAYYDKETNEAPNLSYKGGLDVKYGINESFTLDMMLIPDFGQVQDDDKVLNLSPFETKFDEKRAFFTEGSELFSKADIFYSKRIGAQPKNYQEAEDQLRQNEIIRSNPDKTSLLNATKISGRNNNGSGIGFLNALTDNTQAVIVDTITNSQRRYTTQPLTNYNVMVVDQSMKNNSFVSLINTNMTYSGFTANTSAAQFSLRNKKNTHEIEGTGIISTRNPGNGESETGHRYYFSFGKISGKIRYNFSRSLRSDKFNINDLGYMSKNDVIYNHLNLSYYDYSKVWRIQKRIYRFNINHQAQYNPRETSEIIFQLSSFTQFNNYATFSVNGYVKPFWENNFDEPRVEDRVYREPPTTSMHMRFATDHRKDYYLNTGGGFWGDIQYRQRSRYISAYQQYTISTKASISYAISLSKDIERNNFVYKSEGEDTIVFGKMNRNVVENTISSIYNFNNRSSLSFRLRHYWSEVKYADYQLLDEEGYFTEIDHSQKHDVNYNVFNLDLVYTWRFAPGSELSLVWKNAITSSNEEDFYSNYFDNFIHTLGESQLNSISLKILYYIDYNNAKKLIQKS